MGRRPKDDSCEEVRDMDTLTEEECWEPLGSAKVARLAIAVAGDIEIFPISIVVDGHAVVFRSAEGTKLADAVVAGHVALEVDEVDAESGVAWSVVLKADTELVEHLDDIEHVETLPLPRWHPQYLGRFVRARPRDVHGRRVSRVDIDDDSYRRVLEVVSPCSGPTGIWDRDVLVRVRGRVCLARGRLG
jgi:hypothetical protein